MHDNSQGRERYMRVLCVCVCVCVCMSVSLCVCRIQDRLMARQGIHFWTFLGTALILHVAVCESKTLAANPLFSLNTSSAHADWV